MKDRDFTRKTFCLKNKLNEKVMNLEAGLIKETKHHWSDSAVINALIQFAIDNGADVQKFAKIYEDKK